jgi:hypothetical protein
MRTGVKMPAARTLLHRPWCVQHHMACLTLVSDGVVTFGASAVNRFLSWLREHGRLHGMLAVCADSVSNIKPPSSLLTGYRTHVVETLARAAVGC